MFFMHPGNNGGSGQQGRDASEDSHGPEPPGGMFGNLFGSMFGGKGGKGKGKGGSGDGNADDDPPENKEVNNKRLYELLGIESSATKADIKKAYHKMAMQHHPDKGGDPDTFKDIQSAFEVLSDPEKRQRYDMHGEDGLEEDGMCGPQDLFEQLFGGGMGMGGSRRGGQQPRTKNQIRPMWVTLENLYTSVTRPMPICRKVLGDGDAKACEACEGHGVVVQVIRIGPMVQQMQQPCPVCGGSGSSAKMKTVQEVLDVFIEKGSPDGHKIVFHGKSDEGAGCEPGDVVLVIKQQEHQRFMRKGADLYLEREISLAEALTGFRIVVPHLDGRKLVVRNNPGEVLQPRNGVAVKAVRGGGMPIHGDPFNFGNLFLILSIRFPQALEPAAVSELRRLLGAPEQEEDTTPSATPTTSPTAGAVRTMSNGTIRSSCDETEQVFVEDIDPLDSFTQSKKHGGEAYDEDADRHGMHPWVM